MTMLAILIAMAIGTLIGTVAGVLACWWLARRSSAPFVSPTAADDLSLDPQLDWEIEQAATRWATAHGRPEAAPLVAHKLRLLAQIQQRRRRRQEQGRWSA